jgi:hypothetical protein
MTILGILLLVVAIALYVVPKVVDTNTLPRFLSSWTGRKSILVGSLGLLFMLFSSALFYAKPGHQYYIVFPTGHVKCEYNQGWKLVMPFSRIQEWESFTDIKVVTEGEPTEGIEGPIMNGIPIRFIDKVVGSVKLSVRMQLPQDDESFKQIVEEFRHPKNLINNTLIPTVKEQVINTGYMFTAENYVSGDASNFRATLDEQLKNGGYAVDKKEYKDTITSPIQEDGQREIKEIQTRYEVIKRVNKKTGLPIRIQHDITKNNIIVSQVIVDQVVLEEKFRKKLEDSRDISAQKSIELQKIETAKAAQQRIVAEGERDKAAERVAQEKEQVKALIAIETKLKQEETNRKLAQIALETEKLNSQKKKVAADAQAYENKKLVSAGLTPQEKAQIEKETKIGVAAELSKIKFPETMIMGGDSKGGTPLESLIGASMAKQLTGK